MENDEIEDIKIRRDRVAQDMWEDFQRNLEAREGSRSGQMMMMMMNISVKMDWKLICLFNLFEKIKNFIQINCTDRISSC